MTDYVAGALAGDFRGLNPINRQASAIKPFALMSLMQFRPPGPPALDSAQYAIDFNEVTTPNHPEYPAAHGCVLGSTAEVLRQFYGTKKVRFTFTSSVTGTTRPYETTTGLVQEVMNARVWGGMHFRTSGEHGAELGKNVGRWVMDHHFQTTN